jgi:flavin-dependent dehydrogenase
MLLRDDEVIRAEMILRAEGPASRIARWMGARDPGRRTAP